MEYSKKQAEALALLQDNETRTLLYGGAAGGGKSWLGCIWILKMCMKYPGSRWGIGRKELKSLRRSTLATFFEVAKTAGFERDEHYTYREQLGEINFDNGSQILLLDLAYQPSDPNYDTLGGLELTGCFVDECNQIQEKAWNILKIRIRYKLDEFGIIGKMLGTCNPAKNWTYRDYYKPWTEDNLSNGRRFLPALATDNPKLTQEYIEDLRSGPKEEVDRYYLGKWEVDDDDALMGYDEILAVFTNTHVSNHDSNVRNYITCDVARSGKDKAVIILWRGFEVKEIHEYAKCTIDELYEDINLLKTRNNVMNYDIVIDEDGVGGGLLDMIKGAKGFLNGSSPLMGQNYYNLKTQCYYKLSERVNAGKLYISADLSTTQRQFIIQELEQIKRTDNDSDTKLKIINKKEVKANIGRSPDYSDALMMREMLELVPPKITKYRIR